MVPPPDDATGRPPPAPVTANPVALGFRSYDLGVPNPRGAYSRAADYHETRNWGLHRIGAEEAYRRGYFGQGVTLAVVDDGFDITHPDLAGRTVKPLHLLNANDRVFEETDRIHGTFVAIIAAGARGNSQGPFEVTYGSAGAGKRTTHNWHGVAPQASIMPVQTSGGARPEDGLLYAARNGAKVVNLSVGTLESYWGILEGRTGVWLTPGLPIFRPVIERHYTDIRIDFERLARALDGMDVVAVWAGGNEGWNSENNAFELCGKNTRDEDGCRLGRAALSKEQFVRDFTWQPPAGGDPVPFEDLWGTDCGAANCIDYNDPGGWSLAPLFEPRLLGKWLTVSATAHDGTIEFYSNGRTGGC